MRNTTCTKCNTVMKRTSGRVLELIDPDLMFRMVDIYYNFMPLMKMLMLDISEFIISEFQSLPLIVLLKI